MVKGDSKYLSADYEKVVDVFLTIYQSALVTRDVLRSILFNEDYLVSAEVKADLAERNPPTTAAELRLDMLQFPLKQVGNEQGDIGVLSSLYNGGDNMLKLSDVSETERFKNSVSTKDLIADVKAENGMVVLENGTDGTDATFTGDVTGNLTGDVTGNVKADNGTVVLENGTDGTDATFRGDVTGNLTGNVIGDVTGDITGHIKDSNGNIIHNHNISDDINTAFGMSALIKNYGGIENTAIGVNALASNTVGTRNTAIGHSALHQNVIGAGNTANGKSALASNTEGNNNTASGHETLYKNTTGHRNTAIGRSALYNNFTGNDNTAVGTRAFYENIGGSNNTAIGYGADVVGSKIATVNVTALGSDAKVETSNTIKLGDDNVRDIKTNNSCRISAGVFHTQVISVGSLFSDPQPNPIFHFNQFVGGQMGDIRIAGFEQGEGSEVYPMVCIKTGNAGNALWKKL